MRLTQESSAVQVGGGDGEMIAGDVGDKDASVAGFFFCHGSLKGSLKPASTEIAERRSRSVVMKGDSIAQSAAGQWRRSARARNLRSLLILFTRPATDHTPDV